MRRREFIAGQRGSVAGGGARATVGNAAGRHADALLGERPGLAGKP